ncbi:Ankyrin repeat domain-containing [Hyphodiscus hymeniophilus]|uniref:Ankyrin repeat domain-containing n=1 Tax=Hyphodiscus hymeniophilus TaxID=353542 RepID=A0A9P6VH18_9HELO|nr:Ankyrin repeat domain-containing [Hyphodiscus hymeniophilus]
MSFGIGVGDFLAVLTLANKIRARFADAPEQLKAISDEIITLSDLLSDLEGSLSRQTLTNRQEKSLISLLARCHEILTDLEGVVDKNYYLNSSNVHGFRDKSRRMWKRLKWEPDDIQELRSDVALYVGLLIAFNGSLISKVTLETKSEVVRLHDRQDRREHDENAQKILDWLTPIDYTTQQSDFIRRRQDGTGKWLLESLEFQTWLEQRKQTLYCPGIPGAGKTMLTSIVIEELMTRFQCDDSIGIAYVYCNFNRNQEQKLDDLLLSLLKQLTRRTIPIHDSVEALYNNHAKTGSRPSTDSILTVLHSVITGFSKVFIVVNALDECQVKDGCRPRFISNILDLHSECGANILTTSRFVPDITELFKNAHQLEIRASEEDVRRYVDGHILRLSRCVLRSVELQEKIKTRIIETVDGMFLLAQLHLGSLIDKTTPRAITRALKQLPKGSRALDQAYEEAMRRIQGQEDGFTELAVRTLSWITCAKRPLSSREFEHALAVEAGDTELGYDNLPNIDEAVSKCAGLVTIEEESDIVRLVHYTTQEYFERTQQQWFPEAETEIATTCLTYLGFDTFDTGVCKEQESFKARVREFAFYDYAAKNWGIHAAQASNLADVLVLRFLNSGAKITASIEAVKSNGIKGYQNGYYNENYRKYYQAWFTGLHVAAYLGLDRAITALLRNGRDIDSEDSNGQSPLFWVIEKGDHKVAKLLLEYGARVDVEDAEQETPLSWAAIHGHDTVVKLLLENGADLETRDQFGLTPLSSAADCGHKEVTRLLLTAGANIESKDTDGRTPLFKAATRGSLFEADATSGVVRLLLEAGADLDSKNTYGRTPLFEAAGLGHEEVVRLLLEAGADRESKDDLGHTPLFAAAATFIHDEVIRLLLEAGADLENKDKLGRTPLFEAIEKGVAEAVQLLLEAGADLKSKDNLGRTPLFYAAQRGKVEAVQLLLEAGANRWAKDNDGWTALSMAGEK